MIEAVISDFGGVLTVPLLGAFEQIQDGTNVPPEAYGQAMAYSLREDGVHPLFALERGEITEADFLARVERGLSETAGITVSLQGFGARLMEALAPNHELFDHYRTIRRERGLRFALCTNNVREWEPLWRPKLPIDELFEVVVDSAFVDDLAVNVEAARDAGMHAIHFRDTQQVIAELAALR